MLRRKCKWLFAVLAVLLAVCAAGCASSGTQEATSDTQTPRESDSSESSIHAIDALPQDAASAVMSAAPIGGNPIYYIFDDGLTYYRFSREREGGQIHECTLVLPEDLTDGSIVYASGGGSGEVFIFVEAGRGDESVYLEYAFYTGESLENLSPVSVTVLDEERIQKLNEQMRADNGISDNPMSEYTVKFDGDKEQREYLTAAASYGESVGYVFGNTIYPGTDGVRYVVFGVGSHYRAAGQFSAYQTYRVTSKDGYILSVEKVETMTKEEVLKNGKVYSGKLDGDYSCKSFNLDNSGLIDRAITISGSSITVSAYLDGTDAGGIYDGSCIYDADSGFFSAKLVLRRYAEGELTLSEQKTITGRLYKYGGFVHFLCETSEMGDISPDDPLLLTFVPAAVD